MTQQDLRQADPVALRQRAARGEALLVRVAAQVCLRDRRAHRRGHAEGADVHREVEHALGVDPQRPQLFVGRVAMEPEQRARAGLRVLAAHATGTCSARRAHGVAPSVQSGSPGAAVSASAAPQARAAASPTSVRARRRVSALGSASSGPRT